MAARESFSILFKLSLKYLHLIHHFLLHPIQCRSTFDMKMILPEVPWFTLILPSSVESHRGFHCCESWENLPLEFHKLSIDSIQFAKIIVVRIPFNLLLPEFFQDCLPCSPNRAQNRRRRRLWQWNIDKLHCAISLSIPTLNRGNWSGLCQWFLSDHWSAFLFPWEAVLLFSRDNSSQISN